MKIKSILKISCFSLFFSMIFCFTDKFNLAFATDIDFFNAQKVAEIINDEHLSTKDVGKYFCEFYSKYSKDFSRDLKKLAIAGYLAFGYYQSEYWDKMKLIVELKSKNFIGTGNVIISIIDEEHILYEKLKDFAQNIHDTLKIKIRGTCFLFERIGSEDFKEMIMHNYDAFFKQKSRISFCGFKKYIKMQVEKLFKNLAEEEQIQPQEEEKKQQKQKRKRAKGSVVKKGAKIKEQLGEVAVEEETKAEEQLEEAAIEEETEAEEQLEEVAADEEAKAEEQLEEAAIDEETKDKKKPEESDESQSSDQLKQIDKKYIFEITNDAGYEYFSQSKYIQEKINRLVEEIERYGPVEGDGRGEKLKGSVNTYSRRITRKDRLVYTYETTKDGEIKVIIKSCAGHY